MKSVVFARLRAHGFHRWPEAPPEIKYLAQRHRHEFHVTVEATVTDLDRQVEFHQLQRASKDALWSLYQCTAQRREELEFGASSCEMIAKALLQKLREMQWPVSAVEVAEDGECGAKVFA